VFLYRIFKTARPPRVVPYLAGAFLLVCQVAAHGTENETTDQEATNQQNAGKAELVKIEVIGDNTQLVEAASILLQPVQIPCETSRTMIKTAMDGQKQAIERTARAYGYYHAAAFYEIQQQQACKSVTMQVDAGARTLVHQLDIQILGDAASNRTFMADVEKHSPAIGDGLSHEIYETLKKRILLQSSRLGYFDGQFTRTTLEVDPQANTAAITLHFQSGVRYRIGDIVIEQDALNEKLFQKYLSVIEGEPFDDANLVSSFQALSSTGYFVKIDVSPMREDRADGEVAVRIKAQTGQSISYSAGVGVATDTGPRVKFYYQDKLANQRGHSHKSTLGLSPVRSALQFSYRIPSSNAQTDYHEIVAEALTTDTDTYDSDSFKLGLARTSQRSNGWLRTMGLQYSIDDFDVGDTEDRIALLRPILSYSKIHTESPLRITDGYRLNLKITGASENIVSDINMAQIEANGKYIHALGDKLRFLGRLNLGHTLVDDFDQLPTSLRFFAGGDSSIRGYKYETLGPEDDNGDVIGGESLLVASVELDYEFRESWTLAAFVDAGNAFSDEEIDVKTGAGFGIRWQSPIGPIRLDFGFPIDDPDADDSYRVHFTLGPDL
jgi:translocation and assembly module TamA